MSNSRSSTRRLRLGLLVLALTITASVLAPMSASAACGPFFGKALGSDKNVGVAPNQGARVYTLSINSYLQRCAKNTTRARHQIYIDTRAFPYGAKFMFSISTRNNKGRWQAVRKGKASIFSVTGKQKIQEFILYQRRTTKPGTQFQSVRVRHCACNIGNGSFPIGSTLNANYTRYNGPEAKPGPG